MLRTLRRGAALLLAGAIHATPCASQAATTEEARDLLVPQGMIVGGMGAAPATPPGFPRDLPKPQSFVKLRYPTALAATATDLFVADSGVGALLRVDPITQAVSALSPLPVLPGVRLAAAPDGTLYVLRPDRSEILRLARDGSSLANLADFAEVPRPVAIATEANRNTLLVADASGEVYVFETPRGPAIPLPGSRPAAGEGPDISLLAGGRRAVFGYDANCRCLLALDRDGGVLPLGPADWLVRPTAMIADDHDRLWIIDAGDRTLKVAQDGEEIARLSPAALGLSEITALAADHQRLYVADGPTGRIAVFDILPPRGGRR